MSQALPASTLAATPVSTGITSIPTGQTFAQASQAANAASGVNAAMNQALPLTGNLGIPSVLPASTSPLITAPSAIAPTATAATSAAPSTFTQGMAKFAADPMASIAANKFTTGASALAGALGGRKEMETGEEEYDGPLKRYRFNPETYRAASFADGGIANLASGGYDRMVGDTPMRSTNMAKGGISDLGGYSDGGRMLRGPGDGMSDSIPASISGKRPARLADGEFVVPADVVSHLGNGSTDAGAKTLYSMMDKVRTARTGNKKQGRQINPRRFVPA
jgi:hypothetical protein